MQRFSNEQRENREKENDVNFQCAGATLLQLWAFRKCFLICPQMPFFWASQNFPFLFLW